MKKILLFSLVLLMAAGTAAGQKTIGLVLTSPGLHNLAPGGFNGGVGIVIPMKSFDLRPSLGLDITSQSNGTEQSRTAIDLGVDVLFPLSEGFFSTYYGGGIQLGLDKEKEEFTGSETTTTTTGFGLRGIFGIRCKIAKNFTVGTEIYVTSLFQSAKTDFNSTALAKAAVPQSYDHCWNSVYFKAYPAFIFCFFFALCP